MTDKKSTIRAQFITTATGERLAVIPEAEYQRMLDALEDRSDAEAVRVFKQRLADGEEELMPAEFANRIINGESAIRVWREYRAMTARELAEKAEISAGFLSQIEKGERDGSFETIKKIAAALEISVDDLC
ncbi:helix-turn-helix domain-containing protein [Rhizobium leguminosarum]|uniref:XRE family transcriptional regulator n=1 Tax=Rhizobium leguminosarum bv. viciae TaxID=387 RepID=A0A8G2J3L5_RHILV|nr:helix-turn-helix transcriptional regulator [Rhizobium leguminosarum]NKK18612.1 helix-turn-helix domain-containing protein [Rhizobium leguminosarum bv. viciae]TBX98101.1 XRE family transcriptional regulator [Rhizobium leguminosarum bv. viciae]TBZ09433.1 XRE family transcriptional regulator [Rhizobium leguminosarum bv. viciae]TBZ10937.1 XRE family transcriptional regulator [Rhizobium leguminosarum bv. viciae]